MGISWCDYYGAEGLFNPQLSSILISVTTFASLIAGLRILHLFLVIFTKFHPPSSKLVKVLLVGTWLFAMIWLAVFFFYVASTGQAAATLYLLLTAIAAVTAFGIIVGFSIYSISVLRASSELVKKSWTASERVARANLMRFIRGCQILGAMLIIVVLAKDAVIFVGSDSVEYEVVSAFLFAILITFGQAMLFAAAGGFRRAENVQPKPETQSSDETKSFKGGGKDKITSISHRAHLLLLT